jgi:hypothetical protein
MNPLDVYKKLPKKNCGKCSSGTCMAFAVQLLRRLVPVSECVELDEQGQKEIESMVSEPGDWKERRVQELFSEISGSNFSAIAEGLGVTAKDDTIKLRYLGRDITVTHSGFGETMDIFDQLLILMYIKTAGNKPLTGNWVAFRDLKDGLIRSESFHEACEMTLARMFGKDQDSFLKKMLELGSKEVKGFSAKYSFVINPLPKIPFLILLWPGDEEFDPDCRILFDSKVTTFLDVEALLYLGMAFVRIMGNIS